MKRALLKAEQAAEYAAVGYRRILNLRASGELPAINVGGALPGGARWRFDERDIDRWLESRRDVA